MKTLTAKELLLIKKNIAVVDRRMLSTVTDQEAFDYVNDTQERNNDEFGFVKGRRYISWRQASEMCWDDWDVCDMLGLNDLF